MGGFIGIDDGLLEELEDTSDVDCPGVIPPGTNADKVCDWITKYFTYQKKLKKESRNRVLAMMFLKKVDQSQYGDLCVSLYNQFT